MESSYTAGILGTIVNGGSSHASSKAGVPCLPMGIHHKKTSSEDVKLLRVHHWQRDLLSWAVL